MTKAQKARTVNAKKGYEKHLATIESTVQDNCWVVIYEDTGFKGKTLRLSGPAEHKNLKKLPGADQDWGDKIGSIETGPNARVTVFDDENFGGDHIDTYGPNTRSDVSGDLDDNIDSLRIFWA